MNPEQDTTYLMAKAAELAERSSALLTSTLRRRETQTAAHEQAAGVQASATSPDGSVTVTVDQAGMPTKLDLANSVRGVAPAQLAAVILKTIHEAASAARREVHAIYDPLIAEGVFSERPRLPADPGPAQPTEPQRARPPRARPGDEDFDGPRESWMNRRPGR